MTFKYNLLPYNYNISEKVRLSALTTFLKPAFITSVPLLWFYILGLSGRFRKWVLAVQLDGILTILHLSPSLASEAGQRLKCKTASEAVGEKGWATERIPQLFCQWKILSFVNSQKAELSESTITKILKYVSRINWSRILSEAQFLRLYYI